MPEREDIARFVEELYDIALDGGEWQHALQRLTEIFGSSCAHLSIDNFASTKGHLISFGTDHALAQSYASYYVTRNVLWQRIVQRSLEGILTNRIVMPFDELQRSEFYNDFLRPHGGEELLFSIGLQQREFVTNLVMWRPAKMGAWRPRHMKALAPLVPHLRRALRIRESIGDLHLARDLAGEALQHLEQGVLLVGAQARVRFANRAAESILADASGLYVEQRQLTARKPSDATRLRQLIADAVHKKSGGTIPISRDARPPLLTLVIPLRTEICQLVGDTAGVAIFIKDPDLSPKPSLAAFAAHFDLTPAQAAVARELVKGDGVEAAAARVGLSRATVRTHLINIFQKTSTKRQAELVRLMLNWNDFSATHEYASMGRPNGAHRSASRKRADAGDQ